MFPRTFCSPLITLRVLFPFETYEYIRGLFSVDDFELEILHGIRYFLHDEARQVYGPISMRELHVGVTPTLHPRGKQYLITLGGSVHDADEIDAVPLRKKLEESVHTRIAAYFRKKRKLPDLDKLSLIEINEGINVLQS